MSHEYNPDKPDVPDVSATPCLVDSPGRFERLYSPDRLDMLDSPNKLDLFDSSDNSVRPDNSNRHDWLDTPDGPPDAPLTPDTILQDRYRIVRQLGRGGMGAVYEAVDQRLGNTLAIKETLSSEASMRKQFEREARLLAVMNHPALPKVTDHFVEGNRAFLVMEFIGGRDLARIIAQQPGPFPRDQVIAWADQLLDALIYLHTRDRQVIHRDIKPHNLKLTATGQIALLDFGLAKSQPSDPSVTSSQAFFGYTRHYAPLEQIQDLRTDPRSDIYALGATLYHLLTGVKPPDAMVRAASVVNAGSDPLRPANEIHPAVGPQIAAILNKAMAQKPEDRYTDAQEFREALRRMGRTPAVGIERGFEKVRNEPRTCVDVGRLEIPATGAAVVSSANLFKEPPAYAGGSDKRANSISSSKRIVNASGTDIFVEPPDMQMALVGSARRFGPAGVTVVLALIFAIAGLLYGSQRWFPLTDSATEALSVTPNAAASLNTSVTSRKQDRARVDNAVLPNTRTANVIATPVERAAETVNLSGANVVSSGAKSQSEKRSVVEPAKSQAEKRPGAVTKPASAEGEESPRTVPRKEPHRVGAPSIRFPNVDFRDNGQDNPTPSPQSRVRSDGSSGVAGKPAANVVARSASSAAGKPASSSGGPKFYRAADGTQIVKFPDGSTQYVRPGQRSGGR